MIPLRTKRKFFTLLAVILFVVIVGKCCNAQKFSHSSQFNKVDNREGFIHITDSLLIIKIYTDTLEVFQVSKKSFFKGGICLYELNHDVYKGFLVIRNHEAVLDVRFPNVRRTQIYYFKKE